MRRQGPRCEAEPCTPLTLLVLDAHVTEQAAEDKIRRAVTGRLLARHQEPSRCPERNRAT